MGIVVEETGHLLADRVRVAKSPLQRARGLLGRSPLAPGEALVLHKAPQVHTVGLRYPIDVVFCDSKWMVVHVQRSLRPLRVSRWVGAARYAIELAAGSVPPEVAPGMKLNVDPA